MSFKKRILSFFISCSLLFSGCSKVSSPADINTSFENFTMGLFQQDVSSNTLNLHYSLKNPAAYNIENPPITFGSFESDELATMAYIENCQTILNNFSYKDLSQKNKLTYDILSFYLTLTKESISYSLYEEPLSPITGIHAQLPVLLAEYSFHTEQDVQTYLALLETFPDYFTSLISFEQKKSAAGLFMPDTIADEIIKQCDAFISMEDENYLLSSFEDRLSKIDGLSSAQAEKYTKQNQDFLEKAIYPAYRNLVSALKDLKGSGKNEQGLCYFPKGKEYYQCLVKRETGSTRSIEEMCSLIQEQISTDLLDMQKLLNDHPSLFETSLSFDQNDPFTILSNLRKGISSSFPSSCDVNIQVKYVPTAMESYLSPAFYLIPAIDNTEENIIYINRSHSLDNIHLFTTLAHEGYPGHLYQTTYFAFTNPDPLRTVLNFKGYVEGWATYAEMCSYYLCSIDKPLASLLQKNNSLILGLYALADLCIHYAGWDIDRTFEFFRTYGIEDKSIVEDIYHLILGDPANYLAYYIGYVEILELKREAIKKEGNTFSQKEFHKKLLEIGPAPFEIVNKLLNGT